MSYYVNAALALTLFLPSVLFYSPSDERVPIQERDYIEIRGIYGGIPEDVEEGEKTLSDYGVNAVFLNSARINRQRVALVKTQGARIFAEFNTMHFAQFLEDHPDAFPIGMDGRPAPAPHDWQGVCPTHPGYRRNRMVEFERLLTQYDLDGVWLDYHHAHAAWERPDPVLPDTCFCVRCLEQFHSATKVRLPEGSEETAGYILNNHRQEWVAWRCAVFTDWVREFRKIMDQVRPSALLGSFHNPWSDEDHGGARINKLAIDLKAQSRYLDVLSPMPYHARFGHAGELEWISRQVSWLGAYLDRPHRSREKPRIWPIVQLSDWGEPVPVEQVETVLDHVTREPATGVLVFAWGSLSKQPEKVAALVDFYRTLPQD